MYVMSLREWKRGKDTRYLNEKKRGKGLAKIKEYVSKNDDVERR